MEKDKHFCFWGTKSEKIFISKLGSHQTGKQCCAAEHVDRLKKYLASMPARGRWGEIKREEIEKFVIQRIALLGG